MKMKRGMKSGLFVGLFLLSFVLGDIANSQEGERQSLPIKNAGFEEGVAHYGVSRSSELAEEGKDTDIFRSGNSSGFFRASSPCGSRDIWVPKIDVVPGETYTFSGWVKTDLEQGTVYMHIAFRDRGHDSSGNFYDEVKLQGVNDWTERVMTLTAPAGSSYAELHFRIENFVGTVWLDDFECIGRAPSLADDKKAPLLLGNYPPDGSTISWDKPIISIWYADEEIEWYPRLRDINDSGVDIETMRITLDNKDVTEGTKAGAFSLVYIPHAPLAQGFHKIAVEAKDKAGNSAGKSWSFKIDKNKAMPGRGEDNHNIWEKGKGIKEFYIADVCESHITLDDSLPPPAGHDQSNRKVVEAINSLSPPPAFVINTGDIIDDGCSLGGKPYHEYKKEFEKYKEIFSRLESPLFTVIGNHDVPRRWVLKKYGNYSDEEIHSILEVDGKEMNGREMYQHYIGPLNHSIDYGDWHFIFYDGVQVESFTEERTGNMVQGLGNVGAGWVSPETMLWIEEDLRMQKKSSPTVLIAHHPLNISEGMMVFNSSQLIALLKEFPQVKGQLGGHGPDYGDWEVEGLKVVMGLPPYSKSSAGGGGYVTIHFKGDEFTPEVHYLTSSKDD